MICPQCGAENDSANRFCDQCGARLEPVAVAVPPVSTAATCPTCGAAILPGEAFCDECGTPLGAVVPSAVPAAAPALAGGPAVCPSCGHQNVPGDDFCDNCGAALQGAPAVSAQEETMSEPPQTSPEATETAPTPAPVPDVPAEPLTEEVVEVQVVEIPVTIATEAPAAVVEEPVTIAEPDPQAVYEAKQAELAQEIARQDAIIAQLEPVAVALGAATPEGVLLSLDAARVAREQAQQELDSLTPPAPAIDPLEVARLEGLVAENEAIIAQLEPVAATLGAATPAGVLQSLDSARAARDQARQDLAALTGTSSVAPVSSPDAVAADAAATPTPTPSAEISPAAPSVVAAAADVPASVPSEQPALSTPDAVAAETVVASAAEVPEAAPAPATPEPEPAPVPAPAPVGPRLVLEDGREILLPLDKTEIIVGREDPISGIFPEIDLTPFGGETGGVSRQHARLTRSSEGWLLTDLNSTNYTRIDGAKLDPNVPAPVNDGSKLQFGRISTVFHA